tara:strand:+ start:637 stop:984 length:348 start_codon:yes stop_codon:yes gene_type:complete
MDETYDGANVLMTLLDDYVPASLSFYTNQEMFQYTFTQLVKCSQHEEVRRKSQRVLDHLHLDWFVDVLEKKYQLNPWFLYTQEDCEAFYDLVKRHTDNDMERKKNIASNKDNGER